VALAIVLAYWMQFTPPPQARTADEYDAYLDVLEAATPAAVLDAAARFQEAHPKSQLRSRVLELSFEAYRKNGERRQATQAGEASLAVNPHNLALRAALAAVIANGADDREAGSAETHARRALKELDEFHPPRTIPPDAWSRIEGKVRSAAHTALGLVAFRRGDTALAIREFEDALRHAPDAAVYYRLGKLYQIAQRGADAAAMFRKAAGGDEPAVRALAEKELHR
jgi:tetratricopeptide (TPR) repeat protein